MIDRITALVKKYTGGETSASDVNDINEIYPAFLSEYLLKRLEDTHLPELAKQFLPNVLELADTDGANAFFEDEEQKADRMYQKYPNRCIIYTTSNCFANCRFCSRKEKWKENLPFTKNAFDGAIEKIKNSPEINTVILTGGEILTLPINDISYMVQSVSAIPHIRTVRIGTRSLTANPSAVTPDFCKIISAHRKVVLCFAFNHSSEFTEEAVVAIKMIQDTGRLMLNQSVLLKGVNDNIEELRNLLNACAANSIVPYHLFHCFKVKGVQYFRTEPLVGRELLDLLDGQLDSWCIPRYTLIPHLTGTKVPVCHNGIVGKNSNEGLILQDYRKRKIIYE